MLLFTMYKEKQDNEPYALDNAVRDLYSFGRSSCHELDCWHNATCLTRFKTTPGLSDFDTLHMLKLSGMIASRLCTIFLQIQEKLSTWMNKYTKLC